MLFSPKEVNFMLELSISELILVYGGNTENKPIDPDLPSYTASMTVGAASGAVTGGLPGAMVGALSGVMPGLAVDIYRNLPISIHESSLPTGVDSIFPSSFPISPSWRNDNKTQSGSDYCDGCNYC